MKSEGPDGPDFDGWQASTLFVANKLIGRARLLWSADRLSASRPLSGLQASSLTPAFTPNDGLALEGIVACYRGATVPESHGIPCAATTLLKNVLAPQPTSPCCGCQLLSENAVAAGTQTRRSSAQAIVFLRTISGCPREFVLVLTTQPQICVQLRFQSFYLFNSPNSRNDCGVRVSRLGGLSVSNLKPGGRIPL